MSMMFPYRMRSIVRSRGEDFEPTEQGGGVFNFDKYLDFCPDGFHIKLAFNWYRALRMPLTSVLLEFVNPTPMPESIDVAGSNTDRREILFDEAGTLYSFIEDNLGTWWTLPMRTRPDLPYEVHFTTTGSSDSNVQTFAIDIAYFPNWPSANLHAMLRRLAECGDSPIRPNPLQASDAGLPDRDPR